MDLISRLDSLYSMKTSQRKRRRNEVDQDIITAPQLIRVLAPPYLATLPWNPSCHHLPRRQLPLAPVLRNARVILLFQGDITPLETLRRELLRMCPLKRAIRISYIRRDHPLWHIHIQERQPHSHLTNFTTSTVSFVDPRLRSRRMIVMGLPLRRAFLNYSVGSILRAPCDFNVPTFHQLKCRIVLAPGIPPVLTRHSDSELSVSGRPPHPPVRVPCYPDLPLVCRPSHTLLAVVDTTCPRCLMELWTMTWIWTTRLTIVSLPSFISNPMVRSRGKMKVGPSFSQASHRCFRREALQLQLHLEISHRSLDRHLPLHYQLTSQVRSSRFHSQRGARPRGVGS